MTQPIRIRRFEPTDADYEAISTIGASTPREYALDYEFGDTNSWRAFDDSFVQAGRRLVRYIAEVSGKAIGYAYWFEVDWAPPAGRYWCVIRVLPDDLRHGIGGQLYERLLADLRQRDALAALLELDDTLAVLRPALERRGFREALRSWA